MPFADGTLSGLLEQPSDARALLVFAHGAGADHQHTHMTALAHMFHDVGLATFRFNFPYMQAGRRRVDSPATSVAAIAAAVDVAVAALELPLLLGGHSFGGRMASHAVAQNVVAPRALVFCSFPLHPAKKPDVKRAAHLVDVTVPMLFLSGDRDGLCDREHLEAVTGGLTAPHDVCWLETADHSFKVLKRTRRNAASVYEEAAEHTARFLEARVGL